jgi:hypothetical protein
MELDTVEGAASNTASEFAYSDALEPKSLLAPRTKSTYPSLTHTATVRCSFILKPIDYLPMLFPSMYTLPNLKFF